VKCFREKSTKTRIETLVAKANLLLSPLVLEKNPPKQGLKPVSLPRTLFHILVLEKNPPKQGLKLSARLMGDGFHKSFREKSTKTRIETEVVIWQTSI